MHVPFMFMIATQVLDRRHLKNDFALNDLLSCRSVAGLTGYSVDRLTFSGF